MFEVTLVHYVSQEVIGKYSCVAPRPGEMLIIQGHEKYEGNFIVNSVRYNFNPERCDVFVEVRECRV